MDGPDVSLRGAEHMHHFERIRGDGYGVPGAVAAKLLLPCGASWL